MVSTDGLKQVPGFRYAGAQAGDGCKKRNIGIIYSEVEETYGVGVYTQNDVLAAPVIISKENDKSTNIKRAVLINSGNANAFTGKVGYQDASSCVAKASNLLNINKDQVYIGSTGIIGRKLDVDNIMIGIENVVAELDTGEENALKFIEATMTTDTRPKQASVSFDLNGNTINIAACAKGSGMIMPDMATMLCVIITDALIVPEMMSKALKSCTESTFNRITIDGDTSTNDSIFFLANGVAKNSIISSENDDFSVFTEKLHILMEHIAKELVKDGEGVTKFITIKVKNVPTEDQAKTIAFSIGNSPLVKTTLYGNQLNWGRLLMAIGKAKTGLNCNVIDIYINDYKIVETGEPTLTTEEYAKAQDTLLGRDINITIDFKSGSKEITIWTSDYSLEYIKINANYMT